jgi:hypothetical protein
MEDSEKRSINTRYTLVDGKILNRLFHFVYDHKKEQLMVEPTGSVLFVAYEDQDMTSIDPLGMIVAPVPLLKKALVRDMKPTKRGVEDDVAKQIDGWFAHLTQQAKDARSKIFN